MQANLGAKNHAVIMPDGIEHLDCRWLMTDYPAANRNLALNSIVGAAFGGALNSAYRDVQAVLTLIHSCWSTVHGDFRG